MAKTMLDFSSHLILKQTGIFICLSALFLVLAGCGTPRPVSVSANQSFSISGSHTAGTFSLERVQLGFNGLSSQTFKKHEKVMPSASIKYQGTGHFKAQWLIDGRVVDQVNVLLNRGSLLTLKPKENAIKTPAFGRHTIQLKVVQPNTSFKAPKLIFFVTQ